jgi:CHAT domain-containing protein
VIRDTGEVRWSHVDLRPDSTLQERLRVFKRSLTAPATSALGARSNPALEREAAALGRLFWPGVRHAPGRGAARLHPWSSETGIPFEALRDDHRTLLGERFAISYAPSAMLYASQVQRRAAAVERAPALFVGDPPFRPEHLVALRSLAAPSHRSHALDSTIVRDALNADSAALGRLPRLAWSRAEVRQAARLFPEAEVLTGSAASEPRLQALAASGQLRRYGVIHLATHALIDTDSPLASALVLSQLPADRGGDASVTDGLLSGVEIANTWKLDAELVTLSACETALGRQGYAGDVIGFAHAFLASGARSLLSSLWKVDDEATSLLMNRFYENWKGGNRAERDGRPPGPMPKAVALQEAKRWLRNITDAQGRRRFDHPYYWSAFVLVGDPG